MENYALVVHSRDNLIGGCTIGDQLSIFKLQKYIDKSLYKKYEICQYDDLDTFLKKIVGEFEELKT